MKNIQHSELIHNLKKLSNEQDVKLWKAIALHLEKPTRQRRIVNLSKLNKVSKDNETILIPGKVLGSGSLDHKLTVAAFSFSDQAKEKIQLSNGNLLSIHELMKNNPKGKNIRIIA